jgi:Transcriptional regulators
MNDLKETIQEQLQQLQMIMHRTMFTQFTKMRNPHRGQGRVLAILKLKPIISQKELTYLLNMSKQAVAELITKLEKSGYITREPSEEDKRVMTIKLTAKGLEAADETEDNTSDTLDIFDCLNDEELADFSEYLGRIIKRCEEQFTDDNFEQRRAYMERFMSAHKDGFGRFGHHHGHFKRGGRKFEDNEDDDD